MTEFNYNQTIEYIDGTRDLNFEAARRWARENGTTFEEDINKREPYELEHEEIYMNPETGATETKVVKSPSIKRFFIIGDEPKPIVIEPTPIPEPTEEEKEQAIRNERNLRLAFTDWTQLPDAPLTAEQKAAYAEYRKYLRDYPETEGWYEHSPKTFEEWKEK